MPLKYDPLLKIYQYAAEARALQQAQVGESNNVGTDNVTGADERLHQTLELMQDRVQQQRADLEKLRSSLPSSIKLPREPSDNLSEHLLQLQNIRKAYEILTPASPNDVTLLPPDSLFPAILALKTVEQTIASTRTAIRRTRKEIILAEDELSHERALLQDARGFGTTLKARIERLNNTLGNRHSIDTGMNEIEQERVKNKLFASLEAQEKQVGTTRQGTEQLKRSISLFVRKRLAPILLEEEVMGPDTRPEPCIGSGDEANICNNDGDAGKEGLSSAGLPQKRKIQEKKWPQKDIDRSWNHAQHNEDSSQPRIPSQPSIVTERISEEMEQLINDLVNASHDNNMGSYITLERVSSQARYLISAKVVQPDPKDATRLRLTDIG